MLDVSLVESPVDGEAFSYKTPLEPSIFLGFIIKNQYDNKRLDINEEYSPKKFFRVYKTNNKSNMLPLYGICLKPNDLGDNIIKLIR